MPLIAESRVVLKVPADQGVTALDELPEGARLIEAQAAFIKRHFA
jgi:hypothetical protein